jgi:hypothetical protein
VTLRSTLAAFHGFGVGSSADLMFFNCGDEAKIRFGGHTVGAAEVTGPQDMRSCIQAVQSQKVGSDDIPLSELSPGRQFCLRDSASAVTDLLRVESVSPSARSMTWTATQWWNPGEP